MRIAMIGQRGVPATYGGIEHHVEQLGSRLAARGHDVVVYCRTTYVDERVATHQGMRLVYLPTVDSKHAEAIIHSTLSTFSAIGGRFDVVHYHALGPGLVAPIPRALSGSTVVQTIHGLDNERQKWGAASQAILRTAELFSARVPHRTITVSQSLADHYAAKFQRVAHYIPNGVVAPPARSGDIAAKALGVIPGRYALFMGRLVPEKAPDVLLRAFAEIDDPDIQLVIAGGSSHTDTYTKQLIDLAKADDRVIMAGYVYGDVRDSLYTNAGVFVLPSYLEGLPLTLLEAIAAGLPVVASSIPPHVEIVRKSAPGGRLVAPGDHNELASALRETLGDAESEKRSADVLRSRVLETYDWEVVADATEALYTEALAR